MHRRQVLEPVQSLQLEAPLPVVEAGPVGLAAAAHAHARGLPFVILEAGAAAGAAVRHWGHGRMFSPWRELIDPAAGRLLASNGWRAPDPDDLPTGNELVVAYLAPLAALPAIAPHLLTKQRVVGVGRDGLDKLRSAGRARLPFRLQLHGPDNRPATLARAVIDASGTWTKPNPLASGGLALPEELTLAERIAFGIPDLLDRDRRQYAGTQVLVAGSGHSAQNIVVDLVRLAQEAPGTRILWVMRKERPHAAFDGSAGDALPARGALGQAARRALSDPAVQLVSPFQITGLEQGSGGGLRVHGRRGADTAVLQAHRIIAATGFARTSRCYAKSVSISILGSRRRVGWPR